MARRHMHEFGTKAEHLGAIAVAMRKHAQLNPNAVMRGKSMTLDDYLASPMITAPYRLFDCCLETDGAAAVIVTSAERARDLKRRPVYIMGVAAAQPYPADEMTNRKDIFKTGLTIAAPEAFAMAGVAPNDVDFAEIYDCFSAVVLMGLEGLGLVGRGEAGAFVRSGETALDGRLPVNTHGGLLCEGYLHGMNTVAEAVLQIQGRGGDRQVRNHETCVVTSGAMMDGSALILAGGRR
jgi:acetyl-CoA acetyltransferase